GGNRPSRPISSRSACARLERASPLEGSRRRAGTDPRPRPARGLAESLDPSVRPKSDGYGNLTPQSVTLTMSPAPRLMSEAVGFGDTRALTPGGVVVGSEPRKFAILSALLLNDAPKRMSPKDFEYSLPAIAAPADARFRAVGSARKKLAP